MGRLFHFAHDLSAYRRKPMRLLFFPLLPLLLVPLFVTAIMIFAVGAILLRVLFFVAIAALAGAVLFGGGVFRGGYRLCGFGRRYGFRQHADGQSDARPAHDVGNSYFDDYRRATMDKLDAEAREFRAFLAKLRQAADAADFQAFLNSRRAGGS
jgi:hypothetical protein